MSWILDFVLGERAFRNGLRPNGSDVIIRRTAWLVFLLYGPALTFRWFLVAQWRWCCLPGQIVETLPWLGGIAAGVYAALYARFAAQWSYLANVYNQIKQAEASNPGVVAPVTPSPLAHWKAAFIEDAQDLHLAAKPSIASVIRHWAADSDVESAFCQGVPGGAKRLEALRKLTDRVYDRAVTAETDRAEEIIKSLSRRA